MTQLTSNNQLTKVFSDNAVAAEAKRRERGTLPVDLDP